MVGLEKIGIIAEPLWVFGFLFCVEMVEVAEELVKAVIGRKKFVAVAQVVLAKLSGRVTKRLDRLRNSDVPWLQPRGATRHSYL
jgi:hypothetical protein